MQQNLFTEDDLHSSSPDIAKPFVSRSTFYQGDCLVEMSKIADKSVDLILTDLPYGVTNCKWDILIPFEILWEQYKRIIKHNGAICLFGTEPFSSKMRLSNFDMYKYDWIWHKNQPSNFANAKRMPMSVYEILSVFYNNQPTYNNIKEPRDVTNESKNRYKYEMSLGTGTAKHTKIKNIRPIVNDINNRNATNLKYFKTVPNAKKQHTSEKPVEMLEYFIKTYTNQNDIVLDSCMGVGSTGIACKKTSRHFIGIEKDPKYFELAVRRVSEYCG